MAHYHFTIIQRTPDHGIMLSYMETVESLMWGVGQLGHQVSFQFNTIVPGAVNVISNLGLLSLDEVKTLPANSVFLNLEHRLLPIGPDYRSLAQNVTDPDQRVRWERLFYVIDKHQFWDFSKANLKVIQSMQPKSQHFYIPICWSPTLEKIQHCHQKDIDVVFFGSMTANRQSFFEQCVRGPRGSRVAHHKAISLFNVFGTTRDDLLGRCRVAIHAPRQIEEPEIFGIVRCAHLMANRLPFVSQIHHSMSAELIGEDVLEIVRFCHSDEAWGAIQALLEDPDDYRSYSEQLYACIRSRDLVSVLRGIL